MGEEAMQNHRAAYEELKMNLIHSSLDEQSAIKKAYANILPKIQKELGSIVTGCIKEIKQTFTPSF